MSGIVADVTPLVITFNEAANIGRTLAALDWARQIVVIDSGSTDETLALLAANPRVRIVQRAFDSFAEQCNFGLTQVTTPWVLSIDADYELTAEVVAEIGALRPSDDRAGFRAGFVYCVFGRALPSTLYPPRVVLYRRSQAHYVNEGHGHRVVIDGGIGDLAGKIRHDDRKPLRRWFASQQRYAAQEADYLDATEPARLKRIDRLRALGWPAPLLMLGYVLVWKGYLWQGRAGLYYAFQRVLAELMLAIEINDRRLRRGLAAQQRADGSPASDAGDPA